MIRDQFGPKMRYVALWPHAEIFAVGSAALLVNIASENALKAELRGGDMKPPDTAKHISKP